MAIDFNDDQEILGRTIFGEAKPHDVDDAKKITCSILNRTRPGNIWPDDVSEVCLQPKQFSCWNHNDPGYKRITEKKTAQGAWFDQCMAIAADALAGDLPDITDGCTHYHTIKLPASKRPWTKGKTPACQSSAHSFYNDIDTKKPQHSAKDALDFQRGQWWKTKTAKWAGSAVVAAGEGARQAVDQADKTESAVQKAVAVAGPAKEAVAAQLDQVAEVTTKAAPALDFVERISYAFGHYGLAILFLVIAACGIGVLINRRTMRLKGLA